MKKGRYASSPYGIMRDRIAEREKERKENEIKKRFPYKYFLNN